MWGLPWCVALFAASLLRHHTQLQVNPDANGPCKRGLEMTVTRLNGSTVSLIGWGDDFSHTSSTRATSQCNQFCLWYWCLQRIHLTLKMKQWQVLAVHLVRLFLRSNISDVTISMFKYSDHPLPKYIWNVSVCSAILLFPGRRLCEIILYLPGKQTHLPDEPRPSKSERQESTLHWLPNPYSWKLTAAVSV